MGQTRIEWADAVWNPITGCTPISEGCENCYARRMAKRLRGRYGYPKDDPFKVTLHPDKLSEPLKWKKPRRIFVCSMGDLFHDNVPDEFISRVFSVIGQCLQHTFMVLTKRPERMKAFIEDYYAYEAPDGEKGVHIQRNLWLGVTAENQARANERIPILLQIPAAVRFVSVEPMLGPVDLTNIPISNVGALHRCDALRGYGGWGDYDRSKYCIHWVICGGETGPLARPMHPDWVRSLRDQCVASGVPFFFKQWGEWYNFDPDTSVCKIGKKKAGRLLDGREWDEFPEATR